MMIKGAFKKIFSDANGYKALSEDEETGNDKQSHVYDRYKQIEKLPFEQQLDMLERLSDSPAELKAFQAYVSERLKVPPKATSKDNIKIKLTSKHIHRR